MIPELGYFSLLLALCLAVVQAVLPLAGAARGQAAWMAVARPAVRAQFLMLLIAIGCLAWSFAQMDYSVLYVVQHSNSALPLQYRLAAVWGGHEGSLLLWSLLLSAWGVAVSFASRGLPEQFVARVLGVMALVSIGFLLFMIATSNPFERLSPAAPDGVDLNPLLQDPALIIHPPMLYMGYVGFSVVFSFAIAALLGRKLDLAWVRWARPWTLAAWAFLSLGIGLGSWWAYYELGWGGWWFWDPVENASFMPWLVGTALIHSLSVTEKRGAFASWTVLLAITAFSLSLLGTFLVRSGVLVSVHAFATDPARGTFILIFLGLVVCLSLLLYAMRAPSIGQGGSFHAVSRETMLLLNNIMFFVAAVTVLLGTLYPLILDALGFGKISVGPPYFNTVFIPLMAPVIFLMGVGPVARWKRAALPDLVVLLRWAFITGVLATFLVMVLMPGKGSLLTALGVLLAAWLLSSQLFDLYRKHSRGYRKLSRSYYGMLLAHTGIAFFIIGVSLSGGYGEETEVALGPGDSAVLGGYRFQFDGVRPVSGPNYDAIEGMVEVYRGAESVTTLLPQKRTYRVQNRVMTEAAIDGGLSRHLYVALGEPAGVNRWSLRLYHKPFVQWIWMGVLAMAMGGLLAASDRRYRLAARQAERQEMPPAPEPVT